jgi:Rne/Rng family ribonuclease
MSEVAAVDRILVEALPGDHRIALVADGRLVELKIERGAPADRVGAVLLGRVLRVTPGAAFVDIGAARPGLLDRRPRAAPVAEGEALVVQLDKAPIDDKGAGLTTDVTLVGRWLVYAPLAPGLAISRRLGDAATRARLAAAMGEAMRPGEGFIVRRAAAAAEPADLLGEAERLRADWAHVSERRRAARPPTLLRPGPSALDEALLQHAGTLHQVVFDCRQALDQSRRFCAERIPELVPRLAHERAPDGLFERHDLAADIEVALSRRVTLPGGGELLVEAVETLTAIDVNPGPLPAGRPAERGWFEASLAAVPEIARQIRLRNLAGPIVIDFPRLAQRRHRERLVAAVRRALAAEPIAAEVLGMTAGGLVEVTRRRRGPPLDRLIQAPCRACAGAGRVASPESAAFEALRAACRAGLRAPAAALTVTAAPAVVAALAGPAAAARAAVEARLGRPLAVQTDPQCPSDRFQIAEELPDAGR